MVMVMVVIRICMIIMVQHQLKFLNFNIHLIHCYNKMVLLNKFISNTNNNVLTVKENIFKDFEIIFLQKAKRIWWIYCMNVGLKSYNWIWFDISWWLKFNEPYVWISWIVPELKFEKSVLWLWKYSLDIGFFQIPLEFVHEIVESIQTREFVSVQVSVLDREGFYEFSI